ncbi:protein of unknown function [Hyphomicrobium sp. 1Nfss2.1]
MDVPLTSGLSLLATFGTGDRCQFRWRHEAAGPSPSGAKFSGSRTLLLRIDGAVSGQKFVGNETYFFE